MGAANTCRCGLYCTASVVVPALHILIFYLFSAYTQPRLCRCAAVQPERQASELMPSAQILLSRITRRMRAEHGHGYHPRRKIASLVSHRWNVALYALLSFSWYHVCARSTSRSVLSFLGLLPTARGRINYTPPLDILAPSHSCQHLEWTRGRDRSSLPQPQGTHCGIIKV